MKNYIKSIIEKALDTLLDFIIPYKLLSRLVDFNNIFIVNIPFYYVFNQKFTRLALLKKNLHVKKKIHLWWSRGLDNFGDELNYYLLSKLFSVDVIYTNSKKNLFIGSVIRFAEGNANVFGSGIIRQREKIEKTIKCYFVRGPYTRKEIIRNGGTCPKIYADPAMLLPEVFNYKTEKLIDILLIPHLKHSFLKKKINQKIFFLSLEVYSIVQIENIIKKIIQSKCVITSSLHIFILCVVYKIPVTVFEIDGISIGGDNIKFFDFCEGIQIKNFNIVNCSENNFSILKLSKYSKTYDFKFEKSIIFNQLENIIK